MAKIEKDKPLPGHTKWDYYECYAKLVLEQFYPNLYKDLKIRDCPDLVDVSKNVGIEVTSAISKRERETVNLWSNSRFEDNAEKRERAERRLKKLGAKVDGGILVSPGIHYSLFCLDQTPMKEIINAVQTKVVKLNKNYDLSIKICDLYIDSELFIMPWEYQQFSEMLVDKFIEICSMPRKFRYIHLMSLCGLWRFEIGNKSCCRENLGENNSKLADLGWKARQMVEGAEESE